MVQTGPAKPVRLHEAGCQKHSHGDAAQAEVARDVCLLAFC